MQLPLIFAGFPCERSVFLTVYAVLAAFVIGSTLIANLLAKRTSLKPNMRFMVIVAVALLTLTLSVTFWRKAIPYQCRQPFMQNFTDPNSGWR